MSDTDSFTRTNYFPTMIFQFDIEDHDELNKSLLSRSTLNANETGLASTSPTRPSLAAGTAIPPCKRTPEYAELLAHINSATSRISEELSYATDHVLKVTSMWSIINPPGNGNRAHVHPGCIWSGVYYVQAPKVPGRSSLSIRALS